MLCEPKCSKYRCSQSWFFLSAITAKFQFFDSLIFPAIRACCSSCCKRQGEAEACVSTAARSSHFYHPTPLFSHAHTHRFSIYQHAEESSCECSPTHTELCRKRCKHRRNNHIFVYIQPCFWCADCGLHAYCRGAGGHKWLILTISCLEDEDEWRGADWEDEEE